MTNFEREQPRPEEVIDVMDKVGAIRVFQLFQQYTRKSHPMLRELTAQSLSKFPNPPHGISINVGYDVPIQPGEDEALEAYTVNLHGPGIDVSAYTTKGIGIRVVTNVNGFEGGRLTVIDQNCPGFNNFLASEFLATGATRRPTDLSARIEYGLKLGFEHMRDSWNELLERIKD